MLDLFRYIQSALRYPLSRSQGFLRMGLGIVRRRESFADCWNEHFHRTKQIQNLWLSDSSQLPLSNLVVLGAGRLFDIDEPLFASHFKSIHFVDADPLCLTEWKKFAARWPLVQCSNHILELSGSLQPWQHSLQKAAAGAEISRALNALRELKVPDKKSPLLTLFDDVRPDAIISLNLLSQLVVMWQNLVERTLSVGLGPRLVAEQEQEWLAAYAISGRALLRQHLTELGRGGANRILLVTDVEYLYYPELPDWQINSPLSWQEESSESGLKCGKWSETAEHGSSADAVWRSRCHSVDALLDVNVENPKLLETLLPEYRAELFPSWLWHICPKSEDGSGEGVVHRVRAIQFLKKS